ncbi:MAG TPA: hypothetical protein P5277_04055 [Candidatus Paceibacterota bacterium]|nr:hypothetical protein [Candidatus Paceibacterota bacterium]
MKNKLILLIISTLLIINIIPLTFSEIIWSNPVTVGFTTQESENSDDDNDNPNPIIPKHRCTDKENERETQPSIEYGDWKCVNNKLQREVINDGVKSIEFGNVCGLNEDSSIISTRKSNSLNVPDSLIILPIVLFLLILITIVLIGLIMLIK